MGLSLGMQDVRADGPVGHRVVCESSEAAPIMVG